MSGGYLWLNGVHSDFLIKEVNQASWVEKGSNASNEWINPRVKLLDCNTICLCEKGRRWYIHDDIYRSREKTTVVWFL